MLNGAVAPTDRILPPGFTGSQLPIKGLAFDPAAAKQALAGAGYGESNPFPQVTFTYGVEGDNERGGNLPAAAVEGESGRGCRAGAAG